MAAERGFSMIELLVAILISVLVLSMTASAFVTQLRVAQRALRNLEGDRAAGRAWSILSGELRGTNGVKDVRIGPGDSVRTRAYRGSAWPCPGDPIRPLRVTYRGDRSPNVSKDSVLALTDDGRWVAADLVGVGRPEVCASTGALVRPWTLNRTTAPILYLRTFESGTYSVDRGALRYRSGRGGRQPVTAERFDSTATLAGTGAPPFVGIESTLPIMGDEYGLSGPSDRRVAWPRRVLW